MKKSILSIIMIMTMCVVLSGCGKEKETTAAEITNNDGIIEVPDISGLKLAQARGTLQSVGLKATDVCLGDSGDYTVASYEPSYAEIGDTITLYYGSVHVDNYEPIVSEEAMANMSSYGKRGGGSRKSYANTIEAVSGTVTCVSAVNIHTSNDKTSSVIGTLHEGENATLEERDSYGWYHITTGGGVSGWVWREYVRVN